jgi:hypothetical protein
VFIDVLVVLSRYHRSVMGRRYYHIYGLSELRAIKHLSYLPTSSRYEADQSLKTRLPLVFIAPALYWVAASTQASRCTACPTTALPLPSATSPTLGSTSRTSVTSLSTSSHCSLLEEQAAEVASCLGSNSTCSCLMKTPRDLPRCYQHLKGTTSTHDTRRAPDAGIVGIPFFLPPPSATRAPRPHQHQHAVLTFSQQRSADGPLRPNAISSVECGADIAGVARHTASLLGKLARLIRQSPAHPKRA